MQIVIDIPEFALEAIQRYGLTECKPMLVENVSNAIKAGTPLPKGHGRLIDADEIQFENTEFDTYGDYCIAFDAIDQADTIIGAEGSESD